VILFAVNDTMNAITRPLDFSAFGKEGQNVTVHTLTDRKRAREPDVTNSFAEPERVASETTTFKAAGPQFGYDFPALTLTVLEWRIAK
jgi:hypothetical protein